MKRLSSLRTQILLIVLLAWLAPTLVLGVLVPTVYFPTLRAMTESALGTRVTHLAGGVRDDIERLIVLAKDVTYDGELTAAHSRHQSGIYSYREFYQVSKNYLERKFARNAQIRYAAFFTVDKPGQFMFTNGGYPSALSFLSDTQGEIMRLGAGLDTRCQFAYRDGQLYLVRNLYDKRLVRFGMLVLSIEDAQLFGPLFEGADGWGGTVSVRLGEYESQEGMDWSGATDGLSEQQDALSFVMTSQSRDYDFRVLVRQEKSVLYADMDFFSGVLAALLVALVPVCILVLYYVHRRVVRPITLLGEAAGRIERGELGARVSFDGPDELGQLGSAFSNMSQKLAHLVDTVYKEQIALRDAQIQAMQSRINPHFLNNALELINWQARMNGEDAICRMVDALSVLMNAALDRGERSMVPLREELAITDAYFYLLTKRFGNRIELTKAIDETLMERLIPRLVIQSLLENAVEHGIAPAGGGHIALNAFIEGGTLVLQSVNNGSTPTAATLDGVARIIAGEAAGAHVGLANVSERLRLIYVGRASVRLYVDGAGDTVAELRLPLA